MKTELAGKHCFNYRANADSFDQKKFELYEKALSTLLDNYKICIKGNQGYFDFQKQEIGDTKDFDIRPDKESLTVEWIEEKKSDGDLEKKITSSSKSVIGIEIGEFRYHLVTKKTDEFFKFPLK